MLIALFSILFGLLLGGPEQVFTVPDVKKELKKHIKDKERKDDLLDLINNSKKEIISFDKAQEKLSKSIQKEILDKEGQLKVVNDLLDSALDARKEHQMFLVEKRLEFQNSISREEWENIIEKVEYPTDKEIKKEDKLIQKEKEVEIDKLEKIKTKIKDIISDSEKQNKSVAACNKFADEYKELLNFKWEITERNDKILRKKDATKKELEDFYAAQDNLREGTYQSLIDLIGTIKSNSSEEEWKAIKKSIVALFKRK